MEKTKNRKHQPSLEVAEEVSPQFNLVNNQYQQKSEVLCAFC